MSSSEADRRATRTLHGQVWWADLDTIRPVLILTRSTAAPLLTRVVVAPITSVARDLGVEVPMGKREGVAEGSVANFDNIHLFPDSALLRPSGRWSVGRNAAGPWPT